MTTSYTLSEGEGASIDTTLDDYAVKPPASPSIDALCGVADHTNNFGTNQVEIIVNDKPINGGMGNSIVLNTDGDTVTIKYIDNTSGWIVVRRRRV